MRISGSYPFGSPLRIVAQADRSPKRVFVLGVYASAVHAKWIGPDGKVLVKALVVANEPAIFWDGSGADPIIASIPVPPGAGRLESPGTLLNGPSGRALDTEILAPLGLGRADAWLCDLVPHTCLNASQDKAITRAYLPMMKKLSLPEVRLPRVPQRLADDARRAEVLGELASSRSDVLVLLGDEPIRHFLAVLLAGRRRRLSDFGKTRVTYGRLHEARIGGRVLQVLPLAHPRQIGALGTHVKEWRSLHGAWKSKTAPTLL